jgi:glutamate carboxypeptidase
MTQIDSLLNWIDQQQEPMLRLLQEWCLVNSGSENLEGLNRMLDLLAARFGRLGGSLSKIQLPPRLQVDETGKLIEMPSAKALHVSTRPEAPLRFFLGGHMDTVYPKEHPFQKPLLLEDNILRGPGTADMKGGLVILLTALEALEQSPEAHKIGWELLINPDEEIGSAASSPLVLACAQRTHASLLFEPAFSDGVLASSRKGSATWAVVVRGKAAHAGRDFSQGCNAVYALAEFLVLANRLNMTRKDVTVNVGRIVGGGPVNIVPSLALCWINLRAADQKVFDEAAQELQVFLTKVNAQDPRLDASLILLYARGPKVFGVKDQKLFDALNEAAQEEGMALRCRPSGGVTDGNTIAQSGIPVLDTLGAIGGELHTDKEYVLLDSLTARARLTARYLLTAASTGRAYAC